MSEGFLRSWEGRRRFLSVASGLALVALAFGLKHWFHADEWFHDRARAWWVRSQPSDEPRVLITIVRLTDESIGGRPDQIPFPRDVLAKVVGAIARFSKPRLICLDVFLEPPVTEADHELVMALSNGPPVFLAQRFRISQRKPEPIGILDYFAAASKGHGVTLFERDHDLVVRGAVLKFRPAGSEVEMPTLAALVAADLNGSNPHDFPERIPIHFPAAPEQAFRFLNAEGLLHATTSEEALLIARAIPEGAVVIIGPFHDEARDVFDVPVMPGVTTSDGVMPGTTLLAYTLRGLLSASPPRVMSRLWKWGVYLGLFVGAFVVWYRLGWKSKVLTSAVWGIYLILAFLEVRSGRFWPVALPTMCGLFGWHLGHSLRHELRKEPDSPRMTSAQGDSHGASTIGSGATEVREGK